MPKSKTCFVIAPIGNPETAIRDRSDKILKWVISPAAKASGYKAIRADQVPEPGMITPSIVRHLVDDPLVVADLTDHNPNVFYELAIRHLARKPVLNIIEKGQEIPFDVSPVRAIEVDYRDIDSVDRCRIELHKHIVALEDDNTRFDNPISLAIDADTLRRSGNVVARSNAQILALLREIISRVNDIRDASRPVQYRWASEPASIGGPPRIIDFLRGNVTPRDWAEIMRGASGSTGWAGATGPTGPSEPTATWWAGGPAGPGPKGAADRGPDIDGPRGPTGSSAPRDD